MIEENWYLRNSLEKKCGKFIEIRRKLFVLEIEVFWFKEVLNIVDNVKRKIVWKLMEVVYEFLKRNIFKIFVYFEWFY